MRSKRTTFCLQQLFALLGAFLALCRRNSHAEEKAFDQLSTRGGDRWKTFNEQQIILLEMQRLSNTPFIQFAWAPQRLLALFSNCVMKNNGKVSDGT